jgi:dihydroneopterin aldolase
MMSPVAERWRITIRDLRMTARVGLHAHEMEAPQSIAVDATLSYSDGPPSEDTFIDYDRYCTRLAALLEGRSHTRLLETLAADIARWSFKEYAALESISLRIHKPRIRQDVDRLGIEFDCTRGAFESRLA